MKSSFSALLIVILLTCSAFSQTHLRTDLNVAPLPNPIPNWGGLRGQNISRVDPDFGTTITRCTDAGTNANGSLQTADEAMARIWNADETMLAVRTTGGSSILMQVDPVKNTCLQLPYRYGGQVGFSGTAPGVLYQLQKNKITAITFVMRKGQWTYQSTAEVADFAKILPKGFKIKWAGTFGMSHDDSTFVVAYSEGVQQTGFNVCSYRVGKGYRMLDTHAGVIVGEWGDTGPANLEAPNFAFPFSLHAANMTPNAAYATLGASAGVSDTMVWDIATLNIREVMTTGHAARGYTHIYPGGMGGGQMAVYPYTDTSKGARGTLLSRDQLPPGFVGDRHYGFGRIDPNDNSIIWASSLSRNGIQTAWEDEVFGYDVAGGVVYRAAHTFNSRKSTQFIVLNAIACPSPLSDLIALTSDAMGSFGSLSGSEKCTLGKNCRGDVLIIRIAPGSTG